MKAEGAGRRIGFIGAGAVGSGLALALHRLGYEVRAVASRTAESARVLAEKIEGCQAVDSAQAAADAADLVFITTPDSAIAPVTSGVHWREGQEVVHCCGASGRDILRAASVQGASTGAFHPFQTFAGIAGPEEAVERLKGVTFGLSADGSLAQFLAGVARDLQGSTVTVTDGDRPLYHAAAILSCGYVVTLLQTALEVLQAAGFTEEQASQAVASLSTATLENVERLGVESSVTGPLVRGDVTTVMQHMDALAGSQPAAAGLYAHLTLLSIPLACRLGLGAEGAKSVLGKLEGLSSFQFREDNQGTR